MKSKFMRSSWTFSKKPRVIRFKAGRQNFLRGVPCVFTTLQELKASIIIETCRPRFTVRCNAPRPPRFKRWTCVRVLKQTNEEKDLKPLCYVYAQGHTCPLECLFLNDFYPSLLRTSWRLESTLVNPRIQMCEKCGRL